MKPSTKLLRESWLFRRARLREYWLTFLVVLLWGTRSDASATVVQEVKPPVRVLVDKATQGGAFTYRYRIVNQSPYEVSTLLIGFDYFTDSPELKIAPTGWDGNGVASTSFRAPSSWRFQVTQTEDDSLINVEWGVDSVTTGLRGGGQLGGFEVTLPQPDARYESGHWTVYLNSAQQSYFSGRIEPSDAANAPVPKPAAAASGAAGQGEARPDTLFQVSGTLAQSTRVPGWLSQYRSRAMTRRGKRQSSHLSNPDSTLAAASEEVLWLLNESPGRTAVGQLIGKWTSPGGLPAFSPDEWCFARLDTAVCLEASQERASGTAGQFKVSSRCTYTCVVDPEVILGSLVNNEENELMASDTARVIQAGGTVRRTRRATVRFTVVIRVAGRSTNEEQEVALLTYQLLASLARLDRELRAHGMTPSSSSRISPSDPWRFARELMNN